MSKSSRFALFCAGVLVLASCKNFQVKEEYFVVNPNPLEVQGGEVNYTVTGTFPEKKFAKKGVLVVFHQEGCLRRYSRAPLGRWFC